MELPHRNSVRLKGYDYSQSSYYFITICSYNRECVFGEIVNNKMVLNEIGKMINDNWELLPKRFPIKLDDYQIMPNHIHSIIHTVQQNLNCNSGAINCAPTGTKKCIKPTLGQIIRHFKAKSSYSIKIHIWQRNYYEHIIRNEKELFKIREYIKLNPKRWEQDRNNPTNL